MSYIKHTLMIILLIAATANAGWVDKQGNKIPDSDNMKSAGDLIAQLVITDNEAQVLKNWSTPSQSVYFPTADKIERNKIITAFIVFGGCAVDANGNQLGKYKIDTKVVDKISSNSMVLTSHFTAVEANE